MSLPTFPGRWSDTDKVKARHTSVWRELRELLALREHKEELTCEERY